MRDTVRPVLIDVTRLISRSWTGRHSTGIDRVAYAYLRHFAPNALAVMQFRGTIRVLDFQLSDQLFEMLLAPSAGFRRKFSALLPRAFFARPPAIDLAGLTYLNVTHTDFDLPEHWDWIERHGLRPACFIHDLIPTLHPHLSRPRAVARHSGRVRSALRHAEQIIVSSDVVADDLRGFARRERLPIPDLIVSPIAGQALRPEVRTGSEPYFLCVGTIEPRKNHALLFDVWRDLAARLGERTPKLVIVGQSGPMTGAILDPAAEPQLAPHVELLEKCPDRELADLMGNASGLLFPSLAEGFGLPLVEALQMGTPAIASDIPIFREIGQGIPTFLGVEDREGWARAILDHASAPVCADTSAARAARFAAPEWSDHFKTVEAAIAPSGLKTRRHYESSLAA